MPYRPGWDFHINILQCGIQCFGLHQWHADARRHGHPLPAFLDFNFHLPDRFGNLFRALEPYGVLQFARSGRIALTKQIKEISAYLKEIDSHHEATAGDVVTY